MRVGIRRVLGAVALGLLLVAPAVGCAAKAEGAGIERSDAQMVRWRAFRAEARPVLHRVLGPTDGLTAECRALDPDVPPPVLGADLGPTLAACADGDLSTARLLAHVQIARIAVVDGAVGVDGGR